MKNENNIDLIHRANNAMLKKTVEKMEDPESTMEECQELMKTVEKIAKVEVLLSKNYDALKELYEKIRQSKSNDGLYIVRIDTVFDIIDLQDIFVKAMNRFKDKLYLLGNFTMSENYRHVQIGKRVLNEYFAKYHPEKMEEDSCCEGIFSEVPLEDDERNQQLFMKILENMDMQYLNLVKESRIDAGYVDLEREKQEEDERIAKEVERLTKLLEEE